MAKDPAFLFYPNDWIGGTMGMTFEEKGAYMELLMMQFNRGHMTEHMIGQIVGQLWVNIKDKFILDEEGKFYNKRLEEEQIKRKTFTESRRNNIKGENQYSKKHGHKDGHMTSHMENENEDVNDIKVKNINIKFETFWDLYEKKVGVKEKIEKKWNNLTNEERIRIMEYVPKYKKATPDKKYRKNPDTFFNQKSWNDEIIGSTQLKFTPNNSSYE